MRRFHNADVYWVQEESKNMGAWPYIKDRLLTATNEAFGTPKRIQ